MAISTVMLDASFFRLPAPEESLLDFLTSLDRHWALVFWEIGGSVQHEEYFDCTFPAETKLEQIAQNIKRRPDEIVYVSLERATLFEAIKAGFSIFSIEASVPIERTTRQIITFLEGSPIRKSHR